MRTPGLWALMMLPGGLAAGHALGYGVAEHAGVAAPASGHGYIGDLWALAILATLAVLVRAFLAGARGELAPVRVRRLAAQQAGLYVAVELAEHAAAGRGPGPTLSERSLVLGVVAQVLVAGVFSLLVRALRRLGVAVAATGRRRPAGRRVSRRPWAVVTSADARLLLDVVCVPRRAPPPGPALV